MADQTYHHGKLQDAILDAAETRLARQSIADISMRQLAKDVSVSPGAPYHHFGDRHGLTLALCQRGFVRLHHALEDANGLRALVDRYLAFAAENGALFSLMFSDDATAGKNAEQLDPYAGPVFTLFQAILADEADISRDELQVPVLQIWAFMHGFAQLLKASPMRTKLMDVDPVEFAHTTCLRLLMHHPLC